MRTRAGTMVITLAAGAAMTALAAPAQADALTWTVTNPRADGAFTGVSGPLTVRSAGGKVLVTCTSLAAGGTAATHTDTGSIGRIDQSVGSGCKNGQGRAWSVRIDSAWQAVLNGTAYNAATGRTELTAGWAQYTLAPADGAPGCLIVTKNTRLDYTNATGALRTTTAQANVGTTSGGTSSCPDVAQGETLVFDTTFTLTPRLTITAKAA
ncbi:hypothetical protein [Actinomadura macrotermitis]|uniref:Secreted protein n=1 Tax=Actinomadura macrotermitis TaxID=2585200 RepID=A0A7K0BSB2_9ACTN|nr:hypothetical protein [Actinomadura macrotermitis]MQY04095.1 hypothetical protein [Actinomadura macrotermitis]